MRGHTAVSLFAILIGAVNIGGALQELVYRGILNSETEPMISGSLGTAAGAMLLAAGIALLVRSASSVALVPAAAYVSVPVFVLSGIVKHYAGWPVTVVGIVFPLFLWWWFWMETKANAKAEPSKI
jgi:hypothetical protein